MLIIFPRGFPHKYSLLRQIGAMLLFKKQHIIALKSAEKISVYICNDFLNTLMPSKTVGCMSVAFVCRSILLFKNVFKTAPTGQYKLELFSLPHLKSLLTSIILHF